MEKTVFLTGSIHPDAITMLAQQARVVVASDPSRDTLLTEISEADVVVVRHPLPVGILDHAPRLRAAIRHGAGVDMIPVDEANRRGVAVANVPGVNAEFVAEFAVGQMINLSRRLANVQNTFRKNSWEQGKEIALGGARLKGRTVGIIGFGAIGKAVAQICRAGFGMDVVAARRTGQNYVDQEITRLELDELLSVSDFVVLACPLTHETEGLINQAALAKMKSSAYLINVARGHVVDTGALMQALRNKKIAGAAIDVYEETPLSRDSALFDIENLLLTPHVAAMTEESMRIMACESALQAIDVLEGKYPKNWINVSAKSEIDARWRELGLWN